MTIESDKQQKDLIRDRFTRTAEVFGDYAVAHRVREAELLARMVQAASEDLAIDLACGPGTLALRFARHVRWVCGLDLTPAMLILAQRAAAAEGLRNLDFATSDAHALPFADGSLDIAVSSYSLHHVADSPAVIGEMARVVKKGGRVGVLDIRVSEDPKVAELSNRIERTRDSSHTRTLTQSEFEALFTAHRLLVVGTHIQEDPRPFDHWMLVAGWKPGDPEYIETRRLLEATIQDDSAGFHPRHVVAPGSQQCGEPELHFVNTMLFIAAEKT
jgi:ubiquinone/menaquinone biosynthesis C-methylase UbiE